MLRRISRPAIRWLVSGVAELFLRSRGWRLPPYFSLRDRIAFLFHGIEQDIVRCTARLLHPGMTVLDVGANIGFLARHFCRCVGSKGRVIAFEPEPENASVLRHNLRGHPQSEVVQVALGEKTGPARFFVHKLSGTGNSLVPHAAEMRPVDVECQRLDDFLTSRPEIKPDLVKIDVEGGECLVLQGMTKTIQASPGLMLLMELCPANLGGPERAEALVDRLRSLEHLVFLVKNDGSVEPFRSLSAHAEAFLPHGYVNVLSLRTPSATRLL